MLPRAFVLAMLITQAGTTVTAPAFTLVLPGQWERQPSDTGMKYTRGADTAFITTVQPAEKLNREERRVRVHRIASMRRDVIRDMTRDRAHISAVIDTADNERNIAYFSGDDPKNGKRFYVAVIGLRNDVIVTAALYRSLRASPAGFEDMARAIIESVTSRRQ